jgi:hypothetical protein
MYTFFKTEIEQALVSVLLISGVDHMLMNVVWRYGTAKD